MGNSRDKLRKEVIDTIKASYAGGAKAKVTKGKKKKTAETPEEVVMGAARRAPRSRTVGPVVA